MHPQTSKDEKSCEEGGSCELAFVEVYICMHVYVCVCVVVYVSVYVSYGCFFILVI